ncbi:MAG: hypothetical protein RIM99_20650, partial [Cyclobacteriaceae bacterium]
MKTITQKSQDTKSIRRFLMLVSLTLLFLTLLGEANAQFMTGPSQITNSNLGPHSYDCSSCPVFGKTKYWEVTLSSGTATISPSGATANITFPDPGEGNTITGTVKYRNASAVFSSVSVTIVHPLSPPPTPTISNYGCGTTTFARSSPPGGSSIVYYWQTSSGGTSTSGASPNSTYDITSTGTIYLRAYKSGTWSAASSKYAVVNPVPGLASGSNNSRCGSGYIELTASIGSNGNTIKWYNSSGTYLFTGPTLIRSNQTSTQDFFAATYNSTTDCEDTDRKKITAIINPLPTAYSVTGGGNYCSGTGGVPVSLSDTQTGVNYQLKRNGVNVGSAV